METRLFLLMASGWMVAVGCGGGGQGGGNPVPVEEFPARFASDWCGLQSRCCLASGGTVVAGACEADIQASVAAIASDAMADGAIWNASVAGRCLDAVAAADCAASSGAALVALLDTCDDTWDGVIPPGGMCQTYASCAEPAVSGGASAGASCVNSMCVQVVREPPGGPCSDTGPVCDPYLAECVGGTCVALPGAGDPCTTSCNPDAQCVGGTCVAQLQTGAACASDNECASDTCTGAGQCASPFATEAAYCTLP